jgi:hypothetical protein
LIWIWQVIAAVGCAIGAVIVGLGRVLVGRSERMVNGVESPHGKED